MNLVREKVCWDDFTIIEDRYSVPMINLHVSSFSHLPNLHLYDQVEAREARQGVSSRYLTIILNINHSHLNNLHLYHQVEAREARQGVSSRYLTIILNINHSHLPNLHLYHQVEAREAVFRRQGVSSRYLPQPTGGRETRHEERSQKCRYY